MPEVQTEARFDYRGGVSRLRRQNQNEVFYCQNARPAADGTLTVRNGQELKVNIGATGSIEAVYARSTGTFGLRIYSIRRSDGSSDGCYVDGTQIDGPTFGARDYSSIAEYKGIIFFSNGATDINYHTPAENSSKTWGSEIWGASPWGTPNTRAVVTGSPSPPRGSHIKIYKDRMYVGQDDGNLAWSNAGLFETLPTVDFPALNFQVIGGDGDPVTGLAIGEDFLVAFTSGTYQIMTGAPGDDGGIGDMSWQVFNNIGCSASRSVASQGRKVAFLGTNRRMYILEGAILTDIDPMDKMREYFTSFSNGVLRAVGATFYGNELWIRLPKSISESVGRTLVYNTILQNWTVFVGIDSFSFHTSPSTGKLYTGRAVDSKIYVQDSGLTDPNGLIDFEVIGRQEVFGTFRKIKSYKKLGLQLDANQGESIAVKYSLENSEEFTAFGAGSPIEPSGNAWGAEIWGASPWGGISLQNKLLYPASGKQGVRATELRVKISGSVSPGTRLLGYELDAEIIPRDEEVT